MIAYCGFDVGLIALRFCAGCLVACGLFDLRVWVVWLGLLLLFACWGLLVLYLLVVDSSVLLFCGVVR